VCTNYLRKMKVYLRFQVRFSPEENRDLSTKPSDSGGTRYTEDKLGYLLEGKEDAFDNRSNSNINNACINCPKPSDPRIEYNHLFYFCKEHSKFQNIYFESIIHHLLYSIDHNSRYTVQCRPCGY
jgi:predicted nucleic-acid-binding Zn-ribbon protein